MAAEDRAGVVEEDYRSLGHLASIFNENIGVRGETFHPNVYKSYVTKKLGAETLGRIREKFSDPEGQRMVFSFLYINGASTAAYEKFKIVMQDPDPREAMRETLGLQAKRGITAESLMKGRETDYNLGHAMYGREFLNRQSTLVMDEIEIKGKAEPTMQSPETVPKLVGHGNHATFWDTKLGKWDITFEANDMGHIKDIRKGEMTERMDELIVTTVGPRGEDREYYFTVRTDGDQKNIRMLIKSDNKDEDRRYLTNFAVQGKGLVPKKDVVPRVFKSITISDKNNMAQYVAREIRGMEQLAAAPVAKASEIKVQGEYLGAEWLLQGYGQLSLNGKEIEIRIPKKVGMNEDGEMRSERSRDFNSRIKVDVAVFDMYDRSGRNAGLLEGIKVKKGEAIDAVKITNTETNKTIYILGDRNGVYVRDRNGEDLATFDNSMRLKSGRLDDLDVKIIRIMDRKGEIAAEYRAQDIKIEEIARAGPKRERQTSVN